MPDQRFIGKTFQPLSTDLTPVLLNPTPQAPDLLPIATLPHGLPP
jgi:hypothetical protein